MEDQEQPEKEIQPKATVQTPTSPPEAVATIKSGTADTAQQAKTTGQPEEELDETLLLSRYQEQYEKLPEEIKTRCSWEEVQERLLANNSEMLKRATGLRRGGILFGVDSNGEALFKDDGSIPLKYGFPSSCPPEEERKIIRVRSVEEAKRTYWANYFEIRRHAHENGYELFPHGESPQGKPVFSDEMNQAEAATGEQFVCSTGDLVGYEASFLECGDNPGMAITATVNRAGRLDDHWKASIAKNSPKGSRDETFVVGVIRLLRV